MSNRLRNVDVSLIKQTAQVQVERTMHQVIDITVNTNLGQSGSNVEFLPEASIIVPFNTSIAAVTAKVYNVPVTQGWLTVKPYLPNGSGYAGQGVTLTTGSWKPSRIYPKSMLPIYRDQTVHLVYDNSVDYNGPSGSSGLRLGLWVWD